MNGTDSPYLTARQAAAYLNVSYGTFRNKARLIRREPGNRRYTRAALDEFAATRRPRKVR